MDDSSQIFFTNLTNYISSDFIVVIMYLVYFALKHMYFEDLWVKSRKFPKMKVTNHLSLAVMAC